MPFSGRSQSCWEGDSSNIRQKSSRGISYFPWQHGNIIWLWKLKLCRDLLPFFFSASLKLLFSHSAVSDSLKPLGLKHARLPCPSLSPGVCSDSCLLSQWCHLTILSSVTFSSCPQSFLWGKTPSGCFSMSWLFTSDGQGIEASASASVLSMNIQRSLSLFFFFLSLIFQLSAQLSSVAQSCPTLCNPMNHSTPGLPVHHQLPEFTQTHVHRVGDAIQPSHPLSSPSPPAPNPSQHQSLFQWVNSSNEVAKGLEFQL